MLKDKPITSHAQAIFPTGVVAGGPPPWFRQRHRTVLGRLLPLSDGTIPGADLRRQVTNNQ